jgi:hypothetical protein
LAVIYRDAGDAFGVGGRVAPTDLIDFRNRPVDRRESNVAVNYVAVGSPHHPLVGVLTTGLSGSPYRW